MSNRARDLLGGEAEGAVVLVAELDGVEPDLLAFVADEGGGALFVGVEGDEDGDGVVVTGCGVDDSARERVLVAAAGCEPPLSVSVYVENTARQPFLRVEIPAAPQGEEALRLTLEAISGRLDTVTGMLDATIAEIGALRTSVDASRTSEGVTQGKLDKLQKTAGEGVSRIRSLARHLGADDKLVAWERRQLRNMLTTAIDLASRRGRPAESDDMVRQVRKTWSRLSDWVNDELVDPLQKDAKEVLRNLDEEPGNDVPDDEEK
jgi:hypothetical protein